VKPSQVELADMPEWMIDLLKEPERPQKESQKETQGESIIVEGGRNEYLTKMAGSMRRRGFSEDAMFAALQITNREKCVPPLPDGEVYQIAKSISRYEAE